MAPAWNTQKTPPPTARLTRSLSSHKSVTQSFPMDATRDMKKRIALQTKGRYLVGLDLERIEARCL
ncbi:hypothetical protein BYT27DRAFT_7183540 [Phlegmacium glaucopus]|nr:hypothetical protein BYT27DRAFT_7183540 [Phlegmacium glaucopus]